MKIAIASTSKGEDGEISQKGGRAPFYLIYDEEGGLQETVKNPVEQGGGGVGPFVAKMLADKGCRVNGIDIDINSIDIAKDFVSESEFLNFWNMTIADIPDETYDYVVSNEVIEHTHNLAKYSKAYDIALNKEALKKNGHKIDNLGV